MKSNKFFKPNENKTATTNLQKNDIIEITIDNIGVNGEGVARYNGMAIFINGALPTEKIRAKIILVKSSFCIARIEEILVSSKQRTVPTCPVFNRCGGCSLQHLEYSAQLIYKQKKVAETLKKIGGITAEVSPVLPSQTAYGYRNKLSLPVRGQCADVGFFVGGSHQIVPTDVCAIQFDGNGRLIKIFKDFMRQNSLTGYDETNGSGDVRHLVARLIGGVMFVTVVSARASMPKIKAFSALLKDEYGENYALYININTQKTNVILGSETNFISGFSDALTVDGVKLNVHPSSFFQVNDYIRSEIYSIVAKLCGSEVLECYSGSGLLTCILAKGGARVTAIELYGKAAEESQENLKLNNISGVTVICGDCAAEVPKAVKNFEGRSFSVVLDPPRAGCAASVIEAITYSGAEKIIYVSCNPATLARDAKLCCERGYKVDYVQPLDMFPNTMEVETICVFQKQE